MRLFWNMRAALFGPVANTVHFTTAVHPVHVRYRIKPILLYPYHSYIRYRSIPKPSVVVSVSVSVKVLIILIVLLHYCSDKTLDRSRKI